MPPNSGPASAASGRERLFRPVQGASLPTSVVPTTGSPLSDSGAGFEAPSSYPDRSPSPASDGSATSEEAFFDDEGPAGAGMVPLVKAESAGGVPSKKARVDDPRRPPHANDFLVRLFGGPFPQKTLSVVPDYGSSQKVDLLRAVWDSARKWTKKELLELSETDPSAAKALSVAKRYITGAPNSLTSLQVYRASRFFVYFAGEDLFVEHPRNGVTIPIFSDDFNSFLRLAYAMDPRIYDFLSAWVNITFFPKAPIMKHAGIVLAERSIVRYADEMLKQVRSNWLQKLNLRPASELTSKESKASFKAFVSVAGSLKFSIVEETIFKHYVPKITGGAMKFDDNFKFQSLLQYVQEVVILEAADALRSRGGGRSSDRRAAGGSLTSSSFNVEDVVPIGRTLDLHAPPADVDEKEAKRALALSKVGFVKDFKDTFERYTLTDPPQIVPHFVVSDVKFNAFFHLTCKCTACLNVWGLEGGYLSLFEDISMSPKLKTSFGVTTRAAAMDVVLSMTGTHNVDVRNDGTGLYAEVFDVSIFDDGSRGYLSAVLPHLFGGENVAVAPTAGATSEDEDDLLRGGLHQPSSKASGSLSSESSKSAPAGIVGDVSGLFIPGVNTVIYKKAGAGEAGYKRFQEIDPVLSNFEVVVVEKDDVEKEKWDRLCSDLNGTLVLLHKMTQDCFFEDGRHRIVSSTPTLVKEFVNLVEGKGLLSFTVPQFMVVVDGKKVMRKKAITKAERSTVVEYKKNVEGAIFLLRELWSGVDFDEVADLPAWSS